MASPTLRSVSGNYNYSTTETGFTATEPSGAASGDVLILCVVLPVGSLSFTPPSGWNELAAPRTVEGDYTRWLYWIERGGSAPALNVSWTNANNWEWSITAWTGALVSDPIESTALNTTSGSGTQPDPAAVTTATADTTVIVYGGSWRGFTAPAGAISGYTTAMNGTIGGNAGFAHAIAYKAVASAGSEDPGTMSNSAGGSDSNDAITIVLASSAGGNAPIDPGLATETDTAQAPALTKSLSTGLATSASTSFALTLLKSAATGLATSTETALTRTLSKAAAAGLASSTETAQPRTLTKFVSVQLAEDGEIAHTLAFTKVLAAGLASETDNAFSTYSSALTVSAADEADAAQPRTLLKTAAPGMSTESSTALSAGLVKVLTPGIAAEASAAQPLTLLKVLAPGIASGTESSLALTLAKSATAGLATESAAALALSLSKAFSASLASDTSSAFALGLTSGFGVSASAESDAAIARTLTKTLAAGLASEAGSALALTLTRALAAGLASESATAFGRTLTKSLAVSLASESSQAFSLQDTTIYINPGAALEACAAPAGLVLAKSFAPGASVEASEALGGVFSKALVLVALATSTETARAPLLVSSADLIPHGAKVTGTWGANLSPVALWIGVRVLPQ